jgi:HD-GYP domain-containing protein (c-di-GMP phosphodiesterase class II)
MEDHVVFGYAYLRHLCNLAAEMALSHHENYDGTGYPCGLKGEEISLSGRMVRLCDVYDALRATRPYKKAMTHEEAVEIILHSDDRVRPEMFDPELLCLFALHQREFEASFDR